MSIDERTIRVVEAFYDAALDETLWSSALNELSGLTGSQAASFWVLDSAPEARLATFKYINFDPAFIGEYLRGMAAVDPTVRYLLGHPDEPIVHDGLVITERDKDRHPYYEWHAKHSDTRFRLVGQTRPSPSTQAGIALHRTRKAGRYEAGDVARFAFLQRHLNRALAIGFRLGTLGAVEQCGTELLDRSPAAVMLLDERKRLVFFNREAEAIWSANDGVTRHAGGVILRCQQDNERLQGLIDRALSAAKGAGGAMRAPRPSGGCSYGILVAPLRRQYPALCGFRPAVSVIITDPDRQPSLPARRLEAAFSLTTAEARLAALLAQGRTLRDAAGKLGITYGTARTRLASVFQKTETRRQGELVRLLLTTTPPAL